jgi:hypothetical protein
VGVARNGPLTARTGQLITQHGDQDQAALGRSFVFLFDAGLDRELLELEVLVKGRAPTMMKACPVLFDSTNIGSALSFSIQWGVFAELRRRGGLC